MLGSKRTAEDAEMKILEQVGNNADKVGDITSEKLLEVACESTRTSALLIFALQADKLKAVREQVITIKTTFLQMTGIKNGLTEISRAGDEQNARQALFVLCNAAKVTSNEMVTGPIGESLDSPPRYHNKMIILGFMCSTPRPREEHGHQQR